MIKKNKNFCNKTFLHHCLLTYYLSEKFSINVCVNNKTALFKNAMLVNMLNCTNKITFNLLAMVDLSRIIKNCLERKSCVMMINNDNSTSFNFEHYATFCFNKNAQLKTLTIHKNITFNEHKVKNLLTMSKIFFTV